MIYFQMNSLEKPWNKKYYKEFRAKLIGKKIGKLTVIKDLDKRDKRNSALLLCQCECGNLIEVPTGCLNIKKRTKYSCGCSRRPLPGHYPNCRCPWCTGKERKLSPGQKRVNKRMARIFEKIFKGIEEKSSYIQLIGYTRKELRDHLEKLFRAGMSWNNYGTYWVIDHIIPRRLFDQRNKMEIALCWSLPNLQPLKRRENEKDKRGRIDYYSKEFYDHKLEEIRQFVKDQF